MASAAPILVRNLYKSYRGVPVLKGIDLDIYPGELTVVIGRSGCGKSTLLRCLNGIEKFDQGSVRFGEHELVRNHKTVGRDREFELQARALRNNFGMVFQSFNLFGHLTVMGNLIKAPMVVKKIPREQAQCTAKILLDKVGLGTHVNHYPAQLSGGQQQRAAIARALAMAPQVILYDEPTSALDPWLVEEVFQVMRKIDQDGLTQVVVTHEMRFVREVADKVVFMEEGKVIEVGTPEQLFQFPKDPRTAQYLGRFH